MRKSFFILMLLSVGAGLLWFGCEQKPSNVMGPVQENLPVAAKIAPGVDVNCYLSGTIPNLKLDTTAPMGTTAKYVDSPAFSNATGRTEWKEIGTWTDKDGALTALQLKLNPLEVWLGLVNSDDQGTYFDLKAEVLKNGVVIATSLTTMNIRGVTRNPDKALKATIDFGDVKIGFTAGEKLGLRILAKVTASGGHNNARGLRLYYDSTNRDSNFGATTQYFVTYVASGNALPVAVPADEWVNSGGVATGVFPSPVTSGGTQCVFVSDDRPSTITGPTTITGTYQTQYLVTYAATGNALPVTVPADEWVNSGGAATGVFLSPVTDGSGTGCVFVSDDRPATITGPTTITGTYQTSYLVTYAAIGNTLPVTVPADEWVISGGATTGTFPAGGTSDGTRDVFVSAAPALPATIMGPTTITGTYQTQYKLTLAITAGVSGGLSNISGGTNGTFYNAGTALSLGAATPISGGSGNEWQFANWTGGVSNNPLSVTMDAPKSVTANYNLVLLGQELTALSTANIWVGVSNSDMVGAKFDLKAEVYKNGTTLVGSGQVLAVSGGSSGFNNAVKSSISLTPVSGSRFLPGDILSIKLLVRSNSNSGKNSATARLYYNGSSPNLAYSNFDATIGGTNTVYYLRSGLTLNSAPDTTNSTIDVSTSKTDTTFKEFGTWSITLQ